MRSSDSVSRLRAWTCQRKPVSGLEIHQKHTEVALARHSNARKRIDVTPLKMGNYSTKCLHYNDSWIINFLMSSLKTRLFCFPLCFQTLKQVFGARVRSHVQNHSAKRKTVNSKQSRRASSKHPSIVRVQNVAADRQKIAECLHRRYRYFSVAAG